MFELLSSDIFQNAFLGGTIVEIIFLILLAITTASCILVVGVLLVTALLIAPAAAAVKLSRRLHNSLLLAVFFGILVTWGGLMLAFVETWRHLPVGFYIASLAAMVYFISVLVGRKQVNRHLIEHPHPNRKVNET